MPNKDGTGPKGAGRRNSGGRSPGGKGECRRNSNIGGNRSKNQKSLKTGTTLTSAATTLLGLAAVSAPVLLTFKNLLTRNNQGQITQSEMPIPKTILVEQETLVTGENIKKAVSEQQTGNWLHNIF
ncbi:hypothetical protein KKA14_02690 [bacterium]|nr:hypothetical protein [bacterium]